MKYKTSMRIITLLLSLCLAIGIGLFLYNANHSYNINSGFTALPLNYNPNDSSSSYHWSGTDFTVYNGFVKGIQKGENKGGSLVIRALSPLVAVELNRGGTPAENISVTIENINPDFYSKGVDKEFNPVRTAVNTLIFTVSLKSGETKRIEPAKPSDDEVDSYVVLGDSRDGYETFGQIIAQVDALNPVFVIDNGDLVYSGKQNQYRLFDRMVSKISTTLCTTLGNHDIRRNGRETYTKLYGPAYYSFDFGNNHFVFLDSSSGWAQKQAISDEQYAWMESDLKKAQGKRIFVISHVPPVDPRSKTTPNEIPSYIDKLKNEGDDNYIEQKLDNYSENESMDHGFQDKKEAQRFENLMTKYKVDTVYLSHIHSYYDFNKNGVRYIISGGAGAELLTKNSYYHYLIAKTDNKHTITMIQLPSPPNKLLQRYATTVSLFAEAVYKENKAAVISFITGIILLVFLLLLRLCIRLNRQLSLIWILLKDTGKYASKRFRELFYKKKE